MALLLFVLFIVVPIVELAIIIQVGQVVGVGWTLFALIGISVAGAALVKREGLRAWQRFREALAEPRIPATEVVDGALVLLAGALMLTPGFLTDALGLVLVVPLTRAFVNRGVRGRVRGSFGFGWVSPRADRREPPARDEILDVDVIDVERDTRGRGPSGTDGRG